ncbi:hypothetical protein SAV14893_026960 [Streptomyces avermitilis]|uniref:Uncharacterized protein n=1 Tax=Streptomyces avermitilis TaxID=33903 RepID=A0A4D4LYI7_STRAX|nr:hypothetical protein SAV14893_026960 [Streptomyces avermitilis]
MFGAGEAGAAEDLGTVAVAEQGGAQRAVAVEQPLLPGGARGEVRALGHAAVHLRRHLVEQRLLVLEVPVQGRCLDVQLLGDGPEGEPVEAGLVEQPQGGLDDLLLVQLGGSLGNHA